MKKSFYKVPCLIVEATLVGFVKRPTIEIITECQHVGCGYKNYCNHKTCQQYVPCFGWYGNRSNGPKGCTCTNNTYVGTLDTCKLAVKRNETYRVNCVRKVKHNQEATPFFIYTDKELTDPAIKPYAACLNVTLASASVSGTCDIRNTVHLIYNLESDQLVSDVWFQKSGGKAYIPHTLNTELPRPTSIDNLKLVMESLKTVGVLNSL